MNQTITNNLKSRIGSHCWGTDPESVALLGPAAEAGARWVRATRPMQWDTMTTGAPRGYDFAKAGEASVDRAIELGMSVMGLLDARWGNETLHNDLPFASPVWEHLDLWQDWVSATVARYRDRVKFWEVLNEPPFFWFHPTPEGVTVPAANADLRRAPIRRYVEMLAATAEAIRGVDPEARIVVGSGFSDGAFLDKVYQLGGAPYFDIASVHYLPCQHPENFARGVRRLRSVMAANGDSEKPLWDTESGPGGAVIGQEVKTPQDYEATYNVYRHCLAHECGLDRYFWFNPPTEERGRARTYRTLEVLHDLVGEGDLRRSRHFGGEVHACVFDGPSGAVTALWSSAAATVHASITLEGVDYLGEPILLRAERALDGRPIWLYGDVLGHVDCVVTGRRTTVAAPMKDSLADGAPRFPFVSLASGVDFRDAAVWPGVPLLVSATSPLPPESDHFAKTPTSLPADAQVSYDEANLYIRARLVDSEASPEIGSCVLMTIRDSNSEVLEWPYFTGGYCLLALYASPRGSMAMRYESHDIENLPTGRIDSAGIVADYGSGECVISARVPWEAIGPLRPGTHEPYLVMMTFLRADNSLAEIAPGDEPEEWSHSFADPFIVKQPAVIAWLTFSGHSGA